MGRRAPLRRFVVGADVYLWRVAHRHDEPRTRCEEVLTVYRDGCPRAPLRVHFVGGDAHGPGFPVMSGVVTTYAPDAPAWNLNLPSMVGALIARARDAGWDPERARRPFDLDGWPLLPAQDD